MKTLNALLTPNSTQCCPLRPGLFPVPLVLIFFALLQGAQAVSPPPDGGYPGGNTAEGTDALFSRTSGVWNTALGFNALNQNTTGGANTAAGFESLLNNTTASHNTAFGAQALFSNGTNRPGNPSDNTATGYRALYSNADGAKNTANGAFALSSNTEGIGNTATGCGALANNVSGNANTATGYQALNSNAFEAGASTATGYQALFNNTAGFSNTATGYQALFHNTTGSNNTADGEWALRKNTTGSENIAVGFNALYNNTTGIFNIALGYGAGQNLTTGDFNIDIAHGGVAGEAHTIRIGNIQTNTYIAGISGATVAGGVTVVVDAQGHLGTMVSSERFKDQIKAMDKTSEAIFALKPVTFRYKHELDPESIPQFGLIAEEVQKINPDLVARYPQGTPYTVRYEAVNAMLLNEFLKEHHKVEKLEAMITSLATTVKEQAAQIQKVSAQLEMSQPAAKVAKSDQ